MAAALQGGQTTFPAACSAVGPLALGGLDLGNPGVVLQKVALQKELDLARPTQTRATSGPWSLQNSPHAGPAQEP